MLTNEFQQKLLALGLSQKDLEKAASFGTAAFPEQSPQANAVALAQQELMKAVLQSAANSWGMSAK